MPAGNDASVALAELADQFGDGVGHAEDLIQASRARFDGALAEAQLLQIDQEATDDLDKADVAKSIDVDEEQVLDAVVAGKFVRYVAVDDNGRTYKGAFLAKDVGKAPKTVDKNLAEEEAGDDPEADHSSGSPDTKASRSAGSKKSGSK